MELEYHQLELRYEGLRKNSQRKERQLLASLAEVGQMLPIVVVSSGDEGRYVVVDGYKRVRALRRLSQDTVRSTVWDLDEVEALLLERLMRTADSDSPLEQGWLLCELKGRFGLSLEELARRFDKTKSWVSRRVSLVTELPKIIHEHVGSGRIAAYTAMKYLVPLARANVEDCRQLAGAIAACQLSTRQVGELYAGWLSGNEKTRELLLSEPELFLKVQKETQRAEQVAGSPSEQLLQDLGTLAGVARRAHQRLCHTLGCKLLTSEREQVRRCLLQAKCDTQMLFSRCEKEMCDA